VAFDEVGPQGSGGAEAPTPVQNETGHDAPSPALPLKANGKKRPNLYLDAGPAASF
jgi:hypothetical protein